MSAEQEAKEAAGLAELQRHLGADKVRFETTFGITSKGTMHGVTISSQSYADGRKWDKLTTAIYPGAGEGLPELLSTLATMRAEIMEALR